MSAAPPLLADGQPRRDRPFAAMGWMFLACVLFSLMNLAAKRAMRELPFLEVASGRATFGALWIWAFARVRGLPLEVADKKTQWARTGAGIAAMMCGFFALSRLPLGDAVTIGNLTPLILAVVSARALGERTGSGLGAALVLGLAGVGLIAGAAFSHPRGLTAGIVAGLLGACFSASAMISLRRLGPRESAEGVSLHFAAWAAVVTFAFGLPWARWPSAPAALALLTAGLTGGAAQVSMTKAYGLDKAARVGAVGYSGLVLSQAFGVVFLDERPTLRQLGGAALVLASGLLLVGSALRDARPDGARVP